MVRIPDIQIASRRLETTPASVAPSIQDAQAGARAITGIANNILAEANDVKEREDSTFAETSNSNINVDIYKNFKERQNSGNVDNFLADTTKNINEAFDAAENAAPSSQARSKLATRRAGMLERYSFKALDFIDTEQSRIKKGEIATANKGFANIVADDFTQLKASIDSINEANYSGFTEGEAAELKRKAIEDVVKAGVGSGVINEPQRIDEFLSDTLVDKNLTPEEKESFRKAARVNFEKITQRQAIDNAIVDISDSAAAGLAYADGDVAGLTAALNAGEISSKSYGTLIEIIDKGKDKKVRDPVVFDDLLDRYIQIRPNSQGDIDTTLEDLLLFNNDVVDRFRNKDISRSEFKSFIGIKKAEATFAKIEAEESALPFGLSTDTVYEQAIDVTNGFRDTLDRGNDNGFRRRILEEFTRLVDKEGKIDFDADLDAEVTVDGKKIEAEEYINGLVERAKNTVLTRENASFAALKDDPPNAIVSKDGAVNYVSTTSKRKADVKIESNVAPRILRKGNEVFHVFSDGRIEEIK